MAGCSVLGGNQLAHPDPVASVAPDTLGTEDNTQPDEALSALRELEYGSLAKDGERIRGIFDPSEFSSQEVTVRSVGPSVGRGGTASGPSYDIDVESFSENRRVQYYTEFFLGPSRDRFEVWLSQLTRYEGMIRNVFRRHGLPEDMKFLGLIESGYSNTAVSRARAVGMWQFMRTTGRAYGLRVDNWVDERRDPFKATDAAARHLKDLYEQFGSWYVAAAAYNAGATRVSRGITRLNEQNVSDQTFFALADRRYIRRETRDYVPKLIAATVIAKNPASFGFTEIEFMEPLVFDEITVPDQTGLDVLAQLADTTIQALTELNPHFYRGATPPGEEVTVRVPRGSAAMVTEAYATLPVEERVSFLEHRISRGETLSEIAERYNVSLSFIRAANPGLRARSLRIGRRIVIPVSQAARTGTPRRVSPPRNGMHIVRPGDTLWIISQRYGVEVSDLRSWNEISETDTLLNVGQRVRVVPSQ